MTDIVERLRHCSDNCGDEYLHELAGRAAAEIERLRAALGGVLWMAEDWYEYGGDETTFASDHKKALDEATAALAEEKKDD